MFSLTSDREGLEVSPTSLPSPADADTISMPPPGISPLSSSYEHRPGRRPRSDSWHLTRSGNLTSRQSLEGYPSLQTVTPPDGDPSIVSSGRSPSAPHAAMFISPAFRSMAQGWSADGDTGRDQSESPARTATPSEDVFELNWDARGSTMPDPPSKQPPPSPKPQSRWAGGYEPTIESRRRKLEESRLRIGDRDGSDEELGLQVGRFMVSQHMDLDDHVSLPSQFTRAPQAPVAQPRAQTRRPSISMPTSPVKENCWLSCCNLEGLGPLSLDDLTTSKPTASHSGSNPFCEEQMKEHRSGQFRSIRTREVGAGSNSSSKTHSRPAMISTVQGHASRYGDDFEELSTLHTSASSQVFCCRRKLDQWIYAVKRTAQRFTQDLSLIHI
eukprot:TRINITY_DN1583_c0_g1_i1.p1 TRINITY_DN1583_c0_g1~~TRINITY_DN1583_c0_g1_i1.p1  ORF type:complete len:385 (+),score=51.99 TRINITY_DN1583_c0_g1_i1:210-1364(+)